MTPTQEERLAVLERGQDAIQAELTQCKANCAHWQDEWQVEFGSFKSELRGDLKDIYKELNRRLPLWASGGGGLLLAVIGWLVKSQVG